MGGADVRKKNACFGVVVFLFVIVIASVVPDEAGAKPDAGKGERVSICIGGAPGVPLILAQIQGLFAEEGLQVGLKTYPSGAEGFAGFLRGECDLSSVSETAVVLYSFERQDFSILATYGTSDRSTQILANLKQGIRKPEDLRGKRIFVFKGSASRYFLAMFLAKNGIPEKDVRILHAGVPDVTRGLAEGKIDAFCASELLIHRPLKALGDAAVVFSSPGLCMASFNLVAINRWIEARPDATLKVLRALLNQESRMKNDRDRMIRMAANALHVDEAAMARIWDNYTWEVGLSQRLLLSLEHEAQWAMASGQTQGDRLPNFLNFVRREPLMKLKPEAVTMLR